MSQAQSSLHRNLQRVYERASDPKPLYDARCVHTQHTTHGKSRIKLSTMGNGSVSPISVSVSVSPGTDPDVEEAFVGGVTAGIDDEAVAVDDGGTFLEDDDDERVILLLPPRKLSESPTYVRL